MRKLNEENERIKRRYHKYLKAAKRKDPSTIQKAADGILRFEASTNYTSFKKFRIEQVIKFRERLDEEVSKATGNLAGIRDDWFVEPATMPVSELAGIAGWAWKCRLENRIYRGRDSALSVQRARLRRPAQPS